MEGRELWGAVVALFPLALAGMVFLVKVPDAGKQFSLWVRMPVILLCICTTVGVFYLQHLDRLDRLSAQRSVVDAQRSVDESKRALDALRSRVEALDKKTHRDGALVGSLTFTNTRLFTFLHRLGTRAVEVSCDVNSGELLEAPALRWNALDPDTVEIKFEKPTTGTCKAWRQ